MERWNNMRLKQKLIITLCSLLFVVSAGMATFAYRSAAGSMQKSIERSLPELAQINANIIRLTLDQYIANLQGIANRHVIQSMDWSVQQPALQNEVNRTGFLGMAIVSPDGNAQYADGSTASLGDRDYIQQALQGNTFLSDVLISRVTNKPVMMGATPIKGPNGQIVGALIARLDGYFLSQITKGIKYGDNGYSYVINQKGALIAHDNSEYVVKARNFLEEGKTNANLVIYRSCYPK
jgi:methyl-accepting chemotaxis protein